MDLRSSRPLAHALLRPALVAEGWLGTPLRLALGLAGLALVRGAHQGLLPAAAARGIFLYLGLALLLAACLAAGRGLEAEVRARGRRLPTRWQPLAAGLGSWLPDLGRALLVGTSLVDLAFVSLLVLYSGGPLSEAYLLYPLLLLSLLPLYGVASAVAVVAGLTGPAYICTLYLLAGGAFFLGDPLFIRRYLLLFAASLGSVALGWLMARQRSVSRGEHSSRALEQTVTDLGRRVQQLRTLQEGVKAINAALALEDLLALIVRNASQVVGEARCVLALYDEDEGAVVTRAVSGGAAGADAAGATTAEARAARWVVQNGRALRADPVARRLWRRQSEPVTSLISVPLVADGRTIGALTATSPEAGAFSEEDLDALDAFADQAVIAVKTARFYESVRERRSELEAMLRGIGDAVLATDARLRLTALNPVAAQIFGMRRDVVAGQHLSELVDNRDLAALIAEALAGAAPSIIRELALPWDGERAPRYYQALASPVLGEGNEVRGAVVVLRDVTRQKELERAKSDFLSVLSHELRTPLHSIKGFVDIILMGKTGPVSDMQRDFLETVRQQSMVLQSMINDLLEYSRLEAGQTRLRAEPILLGQIVSGVVERLRPLAQEENLELTNLVPQDFPPFEADLARLEQVITNLCFNALKFTPRGGVTISAADQGSEVQVTVSDTGIGIPADQLERIFDRFYQVDGSATRSYRGAGLGLTICKHIVEYHGGRIWAESVEGRGSTFHFVLPKRQPDPEEAPAAGPGAPAAEGKRPRRARRGGT